MDRAEPGKLWHELQPTHTETNFWKVLQGSSRIFNLLRWLVVHRGLSSATDLAARASATQCQCQCHPCEGAVFLHLDTSDPFQRCSANATQHKSSDPMSFTNLMARTILRMLKVKWWKRERESDLLTARCIYTSYMMFASFCRSLKAHLQMRKI